MPPRTKAEPKRDRKFRVLNRDRRRGKLELVCNSCAHQFTVQESPENFYFKCQSIACEERSNLQDVLVVATEAIPDYRDDQSFGITKENRHELIQDLIRLHPVPKEA